MALRYVALLSSQEFLFFKFWCLIEPIILENDVLQDLIRFKLSNVPGLKLINEVTVFAAVDKMRAKYF